MRRCCCAAPTTNPGRLPRHDGAASAYITAWKRLVQGVVARSTTNTKDGNVYDWNVDSSPASLTAWRNMGLDPYFRTG